MQDRFRFRVFDKEFKEMTYNAEFAYDGSNYNNENNKFLIENTHVLQANCFGEYLKEEPTNYEIMQCTGLKDKNGKLIYDLDYLLIDNQKYLLKINIFNISLTNILTGDIISLEDETLIKKSEIKGNYYERNTEIQKNAEGSIN